MTLGVSVISASGIDIIPLPALAVAGCRGPACLTKEEEEMVETPTVERTVAEET
jgi:hypothetical protein